jgi:hypothetical protein
MDVQLVDFLAIHGQVGQSVFVERDRRISNNCYRGSVCACRVVARGETAAEIAAEEDS